MFNQLDISKYYLKIGYLYITDKETIIETILGTCVGICLYDNVKKIGGMNHYLLGKRKDDDLFSTRYGDVSINEMLRSFRKNGSDFRHLSAMIIGGSTICIDGEFFGVSRGNIDVAEEILENNKIRVTDKIVGGSLARKVLYNTYKNEIDINFIKRTVWV